MILANIINSNVRLSNVLTLRNKYFYLIYIDCFVTQEFIMCKDKK